MRTKPREIQSYNSPNKAKFVNLAEEGKDPKPIFIYDDLNPKEEGMLVKTLKEYRDVFSWTLLHFKRVDLDIYQHTLYP